MEGLPFIPGYTFRNPAIQDYKLKQKFGFSNGIRVIRDSSLGIGRRPIDAASSAYVTENETVYYDPSLTYGRVQYYPYRQFVPHYNLYAQKCLCFKAFFRQGVFGSQNEHYRIRYVNIIYYLENDTLSVIEPRIDNVGFDQGTLVRRGKIVKNERDYYHWKHLNVGIDIEIYGVVYHTYDCDMFTRKFMASQGIDIGDKEESPVDPYILNRTNQLKAVTRVTDIDDTRRRFLEYDGMVLVFDAVWEDDFYQILYFLTDDTISVREIHRPNDGKDPVAMLLKKTRVPKNWKDVPSTYPGIYLERGDSEVGEYYSPKDLKIGETIFIFGRRFSLFDCDLFTRRYYSGMLGIDQPSHIEPPIKDKRPSNYKLTSHEYVPMKKHIIRQIVNFPKKLRYSMKMDAVRPEDESRAFILEYNLSDGKIQIKECVKPNSGRKGGTFLSARQIRKPGIESEDPEYYGPEDFFIGAKINVFNHYFIITGADLFVYRYIEENSEKFNENLKKNMRDYFVQLGLLQNDFDSRAVKIEENANFDLKSCKEEADKDAYEMEFCLKNCQNEDQLKGDEENVDLKSSLPLPNKLCLNLNEGQEEEEIVNSDEYYEKEKNKDLTRRELRWSDQIEKYKEEHPISSFRKDYLEKNTIHEPHYFSDRNKKFQMGQLNHEEATESLKSKFPAPQEKFEICNSKLQ